MISYTNTRHPKYLSPTAILFKRITKIWYYEIYCV